MNVHVSDFIFEEIRKHAESEYPRECCGVITDTGIIRCVNLSNAPYKTWRIDGNELTRIARRNTIRGYYHSHPDAPAIPSRSDLAQATCFDMRYVIASVIRGECKDTQEFVLTQNSEAKQFIRKGINTS